MEHIFFLQASPLAWDFCSIAQWYRHERPRIIVRYAGFEPAGLVRATIELVSDAGVAGSAALPGELELVGRGQYRLLGHAYSHTLFCIQELLLLPAGNRTGTRLELKVC